MIVTDGGELFEVPIPPHIVAQLVTQLQADREDTDRALKALSPMTSAPPPVGTPTKPKAWKHRRRCQKCEQLTATDPCQHCGTKIAPPGARDLKL